MASVAAGTPERSHQHARGHAVFRLVVVVLALALLLRVSYEVTLAAELLFRISRGGMG